MGELADDAQHFRVRLRHDGERVIALDGEAVRHPWSTCPEALVPLRELEGMALSVRSTGVGAVSEARRHCTHWFDLAGLAVAHAAARRSSREYRCAVWGTPESGVHATLERDGAPLLAWQLEGLTIRGESPFDGRSLKDAFLAWAESALEPDLAEAAIVLRRACYIAPVRFYELDGFAHASDVQPVRGQCYTYSDGTAQRARRQRGSVRDYSGRPEALLSEAEPSAEPPLATAAPESGPPAASASTPPAGPASAARLALAGLLATAAALYTWNAFTVPPLAGYDAGGHAGYILGIAEEGRLPHPFAGWSTFHPPLYYLLGAGVWSLLEPLGPRVLGAGLRAVSALAILGAGAVAFALVQRRHADWRLAAVAAALVLFLPAASLSASMLGNEALGAGFAALALPFLLRVQSDPGRWRDAALAGGFAGLALSTKYSGLFVAAACAVPFARSGLDRRALRSLAACLLVGALFALPTYARNLALTGSLVPMTRVLEPMRSIEARFVLQPRRVTDYLRVPVRALTNPYLIRRPGEVGQELNPAMQSVWGLVHAGFWFDPFGNRVPATLQDEGAWNGRLLVGLGLLPSALLLLGFGTATGEALRRRGRSHEAPLVAMGWLGLVVFLAFTWRAPALVAAKASYLLPLLAPAALFFARGVGRLPAGARSAALAGSALAALAAAGIFTNGLVFAPAEGFAENWRSLGSMLPDAYLREAAERLARVE